VFVLDRGCDLLIVVRPRADPQPATYERQKYGPKACHGERIQREKLETAVLRQLTGIYRDGPLIRQALAAAHQQAEQARPALDERRRAIDAEVTRIERSTERYFEAFEQGRLSPRAASQLESVIADGEPEQAKALLRILIAELRVNGRHDIRPTYRVIASDHATTAGVCATSGKVGPAGLEPATYRL
jgi:hypothetical protein